MKTEKQLNDSILQITLLIQEKYPELSKYITEFPVTIPDEKHPEINIKNLANYYDTLQNILKTYAPTHDASTLLVTKKMETILKKMSIDLVDQDSLPVAVPGMIYINELYYEIQYNPKYQDVKLFIDVVDGKEKALMIILNNTGINQGSLNPDNIFKEENFNVVKIIFQCFRKIEFSFTLKRQELT